LVYKLYEILYLLQYHCYSKVAYVLSQSKFVTVTVIFIYTVFKQRIPFRDVAA